MYSAREIAYDSRSSLRWTLRSATTWASLLTLTMLLVPGQLQAVDLSTDLDMNEQRWNEDDGIFFENLYIDAENNSWGNRQTTDRYMETLTDNAFTDIFLESDQIVNTSRAVTIEFDARYQVSNSHNYVVFGSSFEPENALWFGFNNTTFFAGTGSELDVTANQPASDLVDYQIARTFTDDARIGVRLGYDTPTERVTNLQVDADNDGNYETELLDAPLDVSSVGLNTQDWELVSFYGGAGSRIDDILLNQRDSGGDYNNDLDRDQEDAEIICSSLASGGNLAYDYDQNGEANLEDMSTYLRDHVRSLIGDFDYDTSVMFSDFLIISGNFGMEDASYPDGDADCDGTVSFGDFLLLSQNFGLFGSGAAAVPEPSGLSLSFTVLGLAAIAGRRRRG